MEKFIVTGANGYLGLEVCRALSREGLETIAVVRSTPSKDLLALRGIKFVSGNLSSLNARNFKEDLCDFTLIDCAWENGFDHSWEGHFTVADYHLSFLRDLAKAGLGRIVGIGTMHEFGKLSGEISENTLPAPINNYGRAKVALQRNLNALSGIFETSTLWVRCFYFFGSDNRNKSLWTKIKFAADEGQKKFNLDAAKSKFDFLEIDDAAKMLVRLSRSREEGVINLASGNPQELRDFLQKFLVLNSLEIELDFSSEDSGFEGIWPNVEKLTAALQQWPPKDFR